MPQGSLASLLLCEDPPLNVQGDYGQFRWLPLYKVPQVLHEEQLADVRGAYNRSPGRAAADSVHFVVQFPTKDHQLILQPGYAGQAAYEGRQVSKDCWV